MNIDEIRKNKPEGAEFYYEIYPRVHYFKLMRGKYYLFDSGMWIALLKCDEWTIEHIKPL